MGQDLLDILLRQLVSQMPQASKLPLLVLCKQTKGSGWYLVVEECSEAGIVAPPAHCGLPSQALKPIATITSAAMVLKRSWLWHSGQSNGLSARES